MSVPFQRLMELNWLATHELLGAHFPGVLNAEGSQKAHYISSWLASHVKCRTGEIDRISLAALTYVAIVGESELQNEEIQSYFST